MEIFRNIHTYLIERYNQLSLVIVVQQPEKMSTDFYLADFVENFIEVQIFD